MADEPNQLTDIGALSELALTPSASGTVPSNLSLDPAAPTGSLSGALWRRENMIGSFFEDRDLQKRMDRADTVESYDSIPDIPVDLLDHAPLYAKSKGPEQSAIISDELRKEERDRMLMGSKPWSSFMLGMVIGNADPSILVPGSSIYKAMKGSQTVGRAALATGLANVASSTTQEAVLFNTQQTRQLDESVFNIAASAVLGGAIGGGTSAWTKGAIHRKALQDLNENYADGAGPPRPNTLSAAEFDPAYIKESESLAGIASVVDAASSQVVRNPFNSLRKSIFPAANQFVDHAYEHNLTKNKNLPEYGSVANPISVEVEIKKQVKAHQAVITRDYQDIFLKQRGVEGGILKPERAFASQTGLNASDFNFEVSLAIREGGEHVNESVKKAANLLIDKVFEPIKERAIQARLLPKNVSRKTAIGYLTRIIDVDKVKLDPAGYKKDQLGYFNKINTERKQMDPGIQDYRKRIAKATRAEKAQLKKAKRLEELKKPKKITVKNAKLIKGLEGELKLFSPEEAAKQRKKLEVEFDDFVPFDMKDSDGNVRAILDDDQLFLAVEQHYDNVTSQNAEKLQTPLSSKAGGKKPTPLHNQVYLRPDKELQPWLVNDAGAIAESYVKGMIPTLELHAFAERIQEPGVRNEKSSALLDKKEKLKQTIESDSATANEKKAASEEIAKLDEQIDILEGPATPDEAQGNIITQLTEEKERAKLGKTEKEKIAIEKMYNQNRKDIEATFDLLKGTYGNGTNMIGPGLAELSRMARVWNTTRLLGGMVISSFADIGYHVMRHGPMSFMREGLMPVLKGMNAKNSPIRQNMQLLKDMGYVLESANGSKIKAMIDGESPIFNPGPFSRAVDHIAGRFGNLAVMNQWQDIQQFMAGNMSMSRTLRDIDAWAKTGKMSDEAAVRLNVLRIGREHWAAIHKEWKRTGGSSDGTYFADYGNWDINNKEVSKAFEAFKSSLVTEIDATAVIPGLADKPLFAHSELGKHMFQFKTFQMASTNKILLAGLSRNDSNFYAGITASLGMGALTYVIKSLVRDPEAEIDLSWDKLTREAIDWSGVIGVWSELPNMLGKMFGGETSRYQSRGISGALAGPTIGAAEELLYLVNKTSKAARGDADITTNDAIKLLRMMPYNNLFYLHTLTRKLTKGLALELGAEES